MPLDINMGSDSAEARLFGDCTIVHAAELSEDLFGLLNFPRVHLDLSQVTEFDTACLQMLVLLQRETRLREHELDLLAPSEAVRELVLLLGCQKLCPFSPIPDEERADTGGKTGGDDGSH